MSRLTARFASVCSGTGDQIAAGDTIVPHRNGWAHPQCTPDTVENRLYAAGIADGQMRAAERDVYGSALAREFEAMDEWNRYWKHGEED